MPNTFVDRSEKKPTTAKANAIAPTPADSAPRLSTLALEKIRGPHPLLEQLWADLDIAPFILPSPFASSLGKECLSLLSRSPPIVFRGNGHWCVGNFRSYRIARNFLDPKDSIHCIELFNLSDEQIRADFLIEFFYDPAVFGVHASDLESIVQAARRAINAGLWKPPTMSVEDHFSKLYRVDKRKFKVELVKSDSPIPTEAADSAMPPEGCELKEDI